MYWNKKLAYWITPKSGPIRSMETLLDANHALTQDLPWTSLKRPHWLGGGRSFGPGCRHWERQGHSARRGPLAEGDRARGSGMTNRSMTVQSTEAIRRWRPPAIVALAATAALTALTAAPPAGAVVREARPAHSSEAAAPRAAGEPLMAIVSIKSQHVTIYDAEGWILRAPVSSGTTGRETPAGVFSVVQKDKDHHSNLYDDAWMPNMLRITWSGIALHGGPLPGYAASHGCVRLPYDFAEKLFDKVPIGMRVIIAPNDAEPVEFPEQFYPQSKGLYTPHSRGMSWWEWVKLFNLRGGYRRNIWKSRIPWREDSHHDIEVGWQL
jgi:hypothetical protein